MRAAKVISNIIMGIGLFLLTDVTLLALDTHMEVDFYSMHEGGHMLRNSPIFAIVLAVILILINLLIPDCSTFIPLPLARRRECGCLWLS